MTALRLAALGRFQPLTNPRLAGREAFIVEMTVVDVAATWSNRP